MGDLLRDALPGHVQREALSGPPSVRVPADRRTTRCGEFCSFRSRTTAYAVHSTAIQALSSETPGRIPWGESVPGHGKAPWTSARGGTGARAPSAVRGRFRQCRIRPPTCTGAVCPVAGSLRASSMPTSTRDDRRSRVTSGNGVHTDSATSPPGSGLSRPPVIRTRAPPRRRAVSRGTRPVGVRIVRGARCRR